MKKLCCALLAAATLALCGCGSFLELHLQLLPAAQRDLL